MQACQFCGAKSWGPVKDTHVLTQNNKTPEDYRQCDGCGSFGLTSIVLETSFPGSYTVLGGPFGIMTPPPPPFDPIAGAMDALKGIGVGPKPYQSRTFDLVRDLMTANPLEEGQSNETYAKWLVFTALLIEDELDRAAKLDEVPQSAFECKPRNFMLDFAALAIAPFRDLEAQRLGLALDCAVAFGALEAQTGNESLKLSPQLEQAYWEKVGRLKATVS